MKELELSVMHHNPRATELLRSLLDRFESQNNVKVNLKTLTWNEAWSELIKVALYRDGPDVSEIGNTWVSDFARMTALEPFSPTSVRAIGGADTFLPALWKSGVVYGQPQIWAVPWLADTRILFFRRDILKEVGIDETDAFVSTDAFENTLTQLQEAGTKMPWAIPTEQTRMSLHHVSSWIWGAGGDFLSEDGRESYLSKPEAIEGLTRYFQLARFLTPAARHKNDVESDRLYWSGEAAITMSGTWLLTEIDTPEMVWKNTGYVSPPGVPFVGGSHLAIWRHCKATREAISLIQFLNQPDVQMVYCKSFGLLPANLDVLSAPSYSDDPQYRRMIERLKSGRSFRSLPLWGMVENRISATLSNLWDEILRKPDVDIGSIVERHVIPLTRKLDLTLKDN